jgi:anti-sigma B factor antagonist
MLKIETSKRDEVMVVKATGSIDVVTRSRLKEAACLYTLTDDVVFDLSEVDFIDSSGLSSLVQIVRSFHESERRLMLAAPASHVLDVLEMTSIDQIVPILGSVEEAIADLKK